MNNISFAMYKPSTDCVIVNTEPNTFIFIRCSLFNRNVILEDPSDIVYLYQLAENNPMTYAEFALKEDGLQGYVDAMRWFNYLWLICSASFNHISSICVPKLLRNSSSDKSLKFTRLTPGCNDNCCQMSAYLILFSLILETR